MRSLALIAAGAVIVLAMAAPAAQADGWHDGWDHDGWRHGHWNQNDQGDEDHGDRGRGWWRGPRWGVVVSPPVVYAPPPVVYAPPPVIYAPSPGLSIGIYIP